MAKIHKSAVYIFLVRNFLLFVTFFLIVYFISFLSSRTLESLSAPLSGVIEVTKPSLLNVNYLLLFTIYSAITIVISYILAYFSYKGWEYSLGENGVMIKKGFFLKNTISIPYDKIQDVNIVKNLFEKPFKVSSIVINTSYLGPKEEKRYIPAIADRKAEQIKDWLLEIIEKRSK